MRLNPLLSQLRTYPQVALDQKKREVQRAGRALYDLGTGDPLEPTPPWIRIMTVPAHWRNFGAERILTFPIRRLRRSRPC